MPRKRQMMFGLLGMLVIVSLCPQDVLATARVLQFDLVVDDSTSYSCESSLIVEADDANHTNEFTYTWTEIVTQDNQDGTFDMDIDQSDMQKSTDGNSWESLAARYDTMTMVETSGRVTAQPDMKYLLNYSSFDNETWSSGTVVDDDGQFILTAVDVNDTWYVHHTVTPYGESAQEVTATATLLEWTTLNGYNVAKVRYTWTEPTRQRRTSGAEAYLDGDLTCEKIVYFAYAEHKTVKVECVTDGTLTYIEGATQDNMVLSDTTTMTLQ